MQSMLNLSVSYGLPLSISAISSHPLTLSKEMADHDLRRRAVTKKLRSGSARDRSRAYGGGLESRGSSYEEIATLRLRAIFEGAIDGDLADLLHDLALACPAKAA